MREYENTSTFNNNNSENNIGLRIGTLMINFHISLSLERNRLIEKYFISFTEYKETMAFNKFGLNLFF